MIKMKNKILFLLVLSIIGFSMTSMTVMANDVEIIEVKASRNAASWTFNVTLLHEDEGWNHYADAWRIVTDDGKELGKRTLYHPHESEQPFTRSLGDVFIPKGITSVYIEAHDSVHGWTTDKFKVALPGL